MPGLSRRAAALGVAACVLLALLLRLASVAAGLPHHSDPDAMILVGQVELIRSDSADRDATTVWRMYPHLVSRLASLIPARVRGGDSLEEHLAQASSTFVHLRIAGALLSLLAIPGTYWLARRFLARGPSLLAAFLVSVSLLSELFAHQARPHAPAAALALLAVVAALRLARKPDWLACATAGVALGLALAALQSGIAVLLPIAVAWTLRDRRRPGAAHRWLAPPLILGLGAAIAYPLYPHAPPVPEGTSLAQSGFMGLTFIRGAPPSALPGGVGHEIHLDRFDGSGFAVVVRSLFSFETMPVIAAILALALGARLCWKREVARTLRRELVVAASYAVPYLIVVGAYAGAHERFCLQLVPFIACAAAWWWSRVAPRAGRAVAVLLLLAVALPQLGACLSLEHKRAGVDGATQLAGWIEEHVAPETERVLLLPGVDVPLARTAEALVLDARASFGSPWTRYQRFHADERWDCPRYHLVHEPLLRVADCIAAIEAPMDVVRASGARLVILLAPSIDRSNTLATHLGEAFQLALAYDGEFLFRAPVQCRDALTQPILGEELENQMTVWTWRLLGNPATIGTTFEVYRY